LRNRLRTAGLLEISEKLEARERLVLEEGVRLFECPDLLALGWLANRERERQHGRRTYYNHNIRIEATNVCVASCLFCSFARLKPGDEQAARPGRPATHRSPHRQWPAPGPAV
jgi:aminodeoxyfutalosine synthase